MSITYMDTHGFSRDEPERQYASYLRIAVIACDEEIHFDENCGFEKAAHTSLMFTESLWI